ncbi:MAG: ABC transporter permease [Anaerolineales bacterium]
MTRYLFLRGLSSLVTLLLFVTAMFFLVQIIVPADFTVQFALSMNAAQREALREELGLNLPLWQQYINWMRDFFTGELGTSFYGHNVIEILKRALPLSMLIFLPGALLAYLLGLQLGKFTGWRSPKIVSNVTTLSGLALFTSFPPWLAWLTAYLIGRRLGVYRGFSGNPAGSFDGRLWAQIDLEPEAVASRMLLTFAVLVAGLVLISWLLTRRLGRGIPLLIGIVLVGGVSFLIWRSWGFGPQAMDLVGIGAIPMLTFILLTFGETMLIMRTSLREHHNQEYVTVARAKGLPEQIVRDKHASRNAILPVVSRFIITLPFLLTGIVIIEDVLDWPGVGSTLFSSLYQQDMPVVMVLFLLVGLVTLVGRLILEVVLAAMDPRLRIAETQDTKL